MVRMTGTTTRAVRYDACKKRRGGHHRAVIADDSNAPRKIVAVTHLRGRAPVGVLVTRRFNVSQASWMVWLAMAPRSGVSRPQVLE